MLLIEIGLAGFSVTEDISTLVWEEVRGGTRMRRGLTVGMGLIRRYLRHEAQLRQPTTTTHFNSHHTIGPAP
jgi:hypothetical protein